MSFPYDTTSINAKDIQNYYAETLPNLIYSNGKKVDLVNITKSANLRKANSDAVLKNVWMKDNDVKGTNSTVFDNNAACEAIGSGDSFDHLSSLARNEDRQARVRCGWVYNTSNPSNGRGAYGIPEGPLNTTASGTWMWNLDKAKQRYHTDICNTIQDCSDIDANMFKGRCGWCAKSGVAVPISRNNIAYPFDSRTACPTNKLITSANKCPPPNSPNDSLLEGFADLGNSCTPLANGAIPRDCLLQKVISAGCSDEGTLYRALKSGADNDYINNLVQQKAWATYQQRSTIPMNETGLRSGKITTAAALDDFKRVQDQAASKLNTSLQFAARDLCFRKGTMDEYDPCSEISDTDYGPFTLECLQKAFLRAGGQKAGAVYPNATNASKWNGLGTWSSVKAEIQRIFNNTQSGDRATQQKAMMDFYGIKMQDKTNTGACQPPFANPTNGKGYTYRGCFKDDSSRTISNYLGNTDSTDECYQKVKSSGFNVMGRQYYGQCFGGNNTDWNRLGSAGCCEINGGGWTNQVYTLDGVTTPPSPTVATLAEHCDNAGWKVNIKPGMLIAGRDFPGDASYITVPAGGVATLTTNQNQTRTIVGPAGFSFCSVNGFNDNVKSIKLT